MQKVLLIEDDKFTNQIYETVLNHDDIDVHSAKTGPDGVKMAAEISPDLIILDLILPEIDGFEVLKQLKANPQTKAIPVIITSNLGQDDEIQRGYELGALDYLIKSNTNVHELVEKIKEHLAKFNEV